MAVISTAILLSSAPPALRWLRIVLRSRARTASPGSLVPISMVRVRPVEERPVGGHSAVTSVMAARAEDSSTMALPAA